MESRASYCAELEALKARYPERDSSIIRGDANHAIQSQIKWPGWNKTRAVMFLDPYGMEVEWKTLQAVAATRAIDVWFLFPLAGLYRQATRRLTDIDEHKRAALTRMFGSDRWEEELYPTLQKTDLFGQFKDERRRLANVTGARNLCEETIRNDISKGLKAIGSPNKYEASALFPVSVHFQSRAEGDWTGYSNRQSHTKSRHVIISAAIEQSTGRFLVLPTPLFEKKRRAGLRAHSFDFVHPLWLHETRSRTALAADNCPVNSGEIAGRYRPD